MPEYDHMHTSDVKIQGDLSLLLHPRDFNVIRKVCKNERLYSFAPSCPSVLGVIGWETNWEIGLDESETS